MAETCDQTTRISREKGIIIAHCTLTIDHDGDHYDDAFLWPWERYQ
jgi:hypothetical protein